MTLPVSEQEFLKYCETHNSYEGPPHKLWNDAWQAALTHAAAIAKKYDALNVELEIRRMLDVPPKT